MAILEEYVICAEILGILRCKVSKEDIAKYFEYSAAETDDFINKVKERYIVLDDGRYLFGAYEDFSFTSAIPSDKFVRPMYYFLKASGELINVLNEIRIRLRAYRGGRITDFLDFALEVGEYSEELHDNEFAVSLYQSIALLSKQLTIQLRKPFFVKTVLHLSKIEFMRGVSPHKTLEFQREALNLINDSNLTADDALLYLYAGVDEHFGGNAEEGARLRKKGIEYLRQFNYDGLEEEAAPFIVWDYYLLGDFRSTIGYYENTVLPLENKSDSEIFTFTYPPLIFSYFFMGDYGMAIALGERICRKALEKKDDSAAILVQSSIARAYIYQGNLKKAEEILYETLNRAREKEYGWGMYYTLFGIAYLNLVNKKFRESRDCLEEAVRFAKENNFSPINASPFTIEIMKVIQEMGFQPVEGFDYENNLEKYIRSPNIHMAGASLRYRAILKQKRGADIESILSDLKKSTELLEESGDLKELNLSYTELALVYILLGEINHAKRYANLVWINTSEDEKNDIPKELVNLIDTSTRGLNLTVMLETMWLEIRHMVNSEKIAVRLLTSFSRLLKLEKGAFFDVSGDKPEIRYTQNLDKDSATSNELERAGTVISEAIRQKNIVFTSDSVSYPKTIVAIPFIKNGTVIASIYLESKLNTIEISRRNMDALLKYSEKMAEAIYIAQSFSEDDAISNMNNETEYAESIGHHFEFAESDDLGVLFINEQISKVAKTGVPILLLGETGVGKEVFSGKIFEQSNYKKSFIKVNCGAIPETLIESELFGYEKGSFTGASSRKKGYFEMAEGGTIFLDEIGELPLIAQVKILRVLQEHELIRVGGTKAVKVDFRLIAATNKNLLEEVRAGRFREDLYFRLNVVQLTIPPLRERKSDIMTLAKFFVEKYGKELGKENLSISPESMIAMMKYEWPGNVRELENAIRKAVIFSDGPEITVELEPEQENFVVRGALEQTMERQEIRWNESAEKNDDVLNGDRSERKHGELYFDPERPLSMEEMEKKYISEILDFTNGKISGPKGAAEILGMKRTTLLSRMKKLGIENARNRGEHQ